MKSFTENEYICPQYHSRYCFDECNWFGNCPDQERADTWPDDVWFCSNCGLVEVRRRLIPMNTGRNTKYMCMACYRKGMYKTGVRIAKKYEAMKNKK